MTSKTIAEYTNSLDIFWLRQHGYLPKSGGAKTGGIKWVYGGGSRESSIGFNVATTKEGSGVIRLYYTQTDRFTDEKTDVDFKVLLTTTDCNLGGFRYWFICPLTKNGVPCGRRIGILYSVGKYFGCRNCADIAYDAQLQGGRFRTSSVTEPEVERALMEVKRKYYNGVPTRKYKRYLRLRHKMDISWATMIGRFGNIF